MSTDFNEENFLNDRRNVSNNRVKKKKKNRVPKVIDIFILANDALSNLTINGSLKFFSNLYRWTKDGPDAILRCSIKMDRVA